MRLAPHNSSPKLHVSCASASPLSYLPQTLEVQVSPLDQHDPSDLLPSAGTHAVLIVMSTFGDGGMPMGAREFYERAKASPPGALVGVR